MILLLKKYMSKYKKSTSNLVFNFTANIKTPILNRQFQKNIYKNNIS